MSAYIGKLGQETVHTQREQKQNKSRHSHKPKGIHTNKEVFSLTKHSIGSQQDKSYHKVEYQNLPTQNYHRTIDIWSLTKVDVQCINHKVNQNSIHKKISNISQLNPIDTKDRKPTQKTQITIKPN